jgi:hypothetical protein
MSTSFTTGLAHGVVALADAPALPSIIDACGAGPMVVAAGAQHALLLTALHNGEGGLSPAALFADSNLVCSLALAHHRILALIASAFDVVPLRLGTLVGGPAGARDLLARAASDFTSSLARVTGVVEFAVTLVDIGMPDEPPGPEPVSSGRAYLLRRAQTRARDSARPALLHAVVTAALAELAADARSIRIRPPRPSQPGEPRRLADAAILVGRGEVARFRAGTARAGARIAAQGLRIDLNGPWPAYSFVAEDSGGQA